MRLMQPIGSLFPSRITMIAAALALHVVSLWDNFRTKPLASNLSRKFGPRFCEQTFGQCKGFPDLFADHEICIHFRHKTAVAVNTVPKSSHGMVFPTRKGLLSSRSRYKPLSYLWVRRCVILVLVSFILAYLWAIVQFWLTSLDHHSFNRTSLVSESNHRHDDDSTIPLSPNRGNDGSNLTSYKAGLRHRFQWGRAQTTNGGAFVHIGKTGGSSLSVLLRNGCHSWLQHPCRTVPNETIASQTIESYYHVADFGLLPKSQHDFYLLTLRDPFDRTVSSFVYEHFLNVQARGEVNNIKKGVRAEFAQACNKCFPTLETFAAHLDGADFHYPHHKSEIAFESCQDFARAVFHGRVRIFHHMFFNYRKIQSLIPNPLQQTLLVTRLEYLWQDWASANHFIGNHIVSMSNELKTSDGKQSGKPSTNRQSSFGVNASKQTQHIRNTANFTLPVTRDLTDQGREILCRSLQPEYDSYFWLIGHAQNLEKTDLVKSLVTARERCPEVSIDFKSMQSK